MSTKEIVDMCDKALFIEKFVDFGPWPSEIEAGVALAQVLQRLLFAAKIRRTRQCRSGSRVSSSSHAKNVIIIVAVSTHSSSPQTHPREDRYVFARRKR